MAILYQKNVAVFQDTIAVEEADGLLEWLMKSTGNRVDLTDCYHMHAANLQVMMAVKPVIAAWPKDAELCAWLESALKQKQGK
jgi:hypothetical protein